MNIIKTLSRVNDRITAKAIEVDSTVGRRTWERNTRLMLHTALMVTTAGYAKEAVNGTPVWKLHSFSNGYLATGAVSYLLFLAMQDFADRMRDAEQQRDTVMDEMFSDQNIHSLWK